MLGFNIADLVTKEDGFDIPSSFGKWEFRRNGNYERIIGAMEKGMCGNTFTAFHTEASERMTDEQFHSLCEEIIDICLILSFITAKCVTVSGSAVFSCPMFIQLGDQFIRSRAIQGFSELPTNFSLNQIFQAGIVKLEKNMQERNHRIFLSHWISSLTCFTIEDLFLATCVEMDIVKQCEKTSERCRLNKDSLNRLRKKSIPEAILNKLEVFDSCNYMQKDSFVNKLESEIGRYETMRYKLQILKEAIVSSFYEGMISASHLYEIDPLSEGYKNMGNDLVHEGTLSGKNNSNKTKQECASIVAHVLNWIDEYVLKVLSIDSFFTYGSRWKHREIERLLPAISLISY